MTTYTLPEWGGRREDLEAAEANGCDNRGMSLKIATFNAKNLFTRPSVMWYADWARGLAIPKMSRNAPPLS